MNNCLFCRIVMGNEIPHKIYEDDDFLVLLDTFPINPGHLLVVTKLHIGSFYDVEDELYTRLMLLVKRAALAVKQVIQPLQVVLQTSGVGNRHVHIHVIPVHSLYDIVPKELVEASESAEKRASSSELDSIRDQLRPLML